MRLESHAVVITEPRILVERIRLQRAEHRRLRHDFLQPHAHVVERFAAARLLEALVQHRARWEARRAEHYFGVSC